MPTTSKRTMPEQHIERAQSVNFVLPRSAAQAIEQVIARAIEHGAGNRNEIFEAAMIQYEFARIVEDEAK